MLKRLRVLAASQGYRTIGLALSASAAKTLQNESGIESETLQRHLARHDGVAHGRGTAAVTEQGLERSPIRVIREPEVQYFSQPMVHPQYPAYRLRRLQLEDGARPMARS